MEPAYYVRYADLFTRVSATAHPAVVPLAWVQRVWRSFLTFGTPFGHDHERYLAVLLAYQDQSGSAAQATLSALKSTEYEFGRETVLSKWLSLVHPDTAGTAENISGFVAMLFRLGIPSSLIAATNRAWSRSTTSLGSHWDIFDQEWRLAHDVLQYIYAGPQSSSGSSAPLHVIPKWRMAIELFTALPVPVQAKARFVCVGGCRVLVGFMCCVHVPRGVCESPFDLTHRWCNTRGRRPIGHCCVIPSCARGL